MGWHTLLFKPPSSKELFCLCAVGEVPCLENEGYVVFYLISGQGLTSSLDCPAILLLAYLSTENAVQLFALGGPSISCLNLARASKLQVWTS